VRSTRKGSRDGMKGKKEKAGKKEIKGKDMSQVGMTYSEAKDKLKKLKIAQHNPACRSSLINQVKLKEGEESAKALDKETSRYFKTEKVLNAIAQNKSIEHDNTRAFNGWGDGIVGKVDLEKEGYHKVRDGVYKFVF
jgi:hypothetical protein